MQDPVNPRNAQESVWDYPRPPRLEPVSLRLRVVFNGVTVADSIQAFRVLETASPPTYYLPREDVQMEYLMQNDSRTFCEWKGDATYWTLSVDGEVSADAAWSYERPTPAFRQIQGYLSFYAGRVSACYVGDELVLPQEGDFYGGWITSNIVGPFKGQPGTTHW